MQVRKGGLIFGLVAQISIWGIAVLCFFYVSFPVWESASSSLITALSLFTGAILLRVMRPFPVMDSDGFEDLEEIETLESSLRHAMRALAFAAALAGIVIGLLVFRKSLIYITTGITEIDELRGEVYSGALGFMIMFIVYRLVYVVRLDFSVLRRQAKSVKNAYKRKRGREEIEYRRKSDDLDYSYRDTAKYPGRN